MITALKVKKSFSKSAAGYARHAGLQKETSEALLEKIAPDSPPDKILDVGCGSGFTALAAKKKWPGASVTALDLALPMAAEAKRNGIRGVVAADAVFPPFKPGVFDGVVSSLAFQWILNDKPDFLGRLSCVIRDGGFLCFSALVGGTLAELREAYSEACLLCTGQRAVFPPFPDRLGMLSLMREAGYEEIRTELRTVRKPYDGVDELFGVLRGIGATAPARPSNPPRRDILQKTRSLYPSIGGKINATYEICFLYGVKR